MGWKISKIILGCLLCLAALFCIWVARLSANHSILSDRAIVITEIVSVFFLLLGVYIVYKAANKKQISK
jgi:hypothetical protein